MQPASGISSVTTADDQAEVIAFLSSPSSYGLSEPVTRHQTHGAMVFLAGDRAYKLKRAVRYLYMDYSTPERRREMCERELAINRRTAPGLYLSVRAIVRGSDGRLTFAPEDAPGALDWVVVMQRFREDELLEHARRRGGLDLPLMAALADTIAGFHRAAEVHHEHGGSAGIAAVIGEDAELFKAAGAPFKPSDLDRLARLAWRALDRHGGLLDQRRREGFVRRCHGDLHLNNICLRHGFPTLFDAIEFNDDFSCIDTLYDLAFLLMDLDHHGLRGHASVVLNRYLEVTGDFGGLPALPLFLSCRAAVKSHVTLAGAQARGEAGGQAFDDSIALLDRAIGYLEPPSPRLIAIAGLSGTGKSTLARHLAPSIGVAPGAIVLRSDIIRKRLLGVPEMQRLPDDAYAPDVTDRVFNRMTEVAAQTLASGYSVVVDAVYGQDTQRRQVEDVARCASVPFDGLWLTAPRPVLEQRITDRRRDASDATVTVLHQQIANIARPGSWVNLDTTGTPDVIARHAATLLRTPPDFS
ncbi:MAG: hypothetical protein FJ271_29810 [Planctomycetes bacterium]|nr:hypothetical protein [Planctomycetota bacterium]